MPRSQKLWTFSAATLRRRFADLLAGLGLPTTKVDGKRPFDLASLGPGGATFLLLESESPENMPRRGRWASPKVMDIYIQEVMHTIFTEQLPKDAKFFPLFECSHTSHYMAETLPNSRHQGAWRGAGKVWQKHQLLV